MYKFRIRFLACWMALSILLPATVTDEGTVGAWEVGLELRGGGQKVRMGAAVTVTPLPGEESPTPTPELTATPLPTPSETPPVWTWPPTDTPEPLPTPEPTPLPLPSETPQAPLAAPKITYAKRLSETSIKLKWSKVTKADGYELYMSTKPNSGFSLVKSTKVRSFEQKKLSKKKTYYFKVRAYRKDGKKVNGPYSKTKKVEVISVQKLTNKILALKKKFPNGKYWNLVGVKKTSGKDTSNRVTSRPCYHYGMSLSSTCNRYYCKASNTIGYQCWGYVDKLSDLTFGVNSKIKSHRSFAKAKVGDHIRYQGHSVLVTEKASSYVKVTECNYGNTCQIRWGRKITKGQLKGALYYTRY